MERLSRIGAADAIMMQQRAAERRTHAADMAARGDHLGAKFEVAEADELEVDAEDILHPLSHTIAPVRIGRGGELATGAVAAAGEQMAAYKNSGHQYPHRSIEACRMANTAARLMDAYQRGLLTLDRLRNGGRQMVTVQHVNVAAGGQAVVAGAVGTRHPGDGQE
jgi:hypothetical protein